MRRACHIVRLVTPTAFRAEWGVSMLAPAIQDDYASGLLAELGVRRHVHF